MLAIVTTASGRHDHLLNQLHGIARSKRLPDLHVVVAMDDPQLSELCGNRAVVLHQRRVDGRLPVATARNIGAEFALSQGVDTLVFLDVDCIPSDRLIGRYADLVMELPGALLSGTVAYLPPPPAGGYDLSRLSELGHAHPARPAPAHNTVQPLSIDLFWSVSFALHATTWTQLGGFCEAYTGYGAEDTDFARIALSRGAAHYAVGGALAYHQWHPSTDPPVQHLHDILGNARTFHRRWGTWPMIGWLEGFERLGLIVFDPATQDWLLTNP